MTNIKIIIYAIVLILFVGLVSFVVICDIRNDKLQSKINHLEQTIDSIITHNNTLTHNLDNVTKEYQQFILTCQSNDDQKTAYYNNVIIQQELKCQQLLNQQGIKYEPINTNDIDNDSIINQLNGLWP